MVRIQLYKIEKSIVRFLMWFSIVTFVLGSILFIISLKSGFRFDFPGDWNAIIFMIQGVMFGIMAYQKWYNGKYFIELSDAYISYQVMGDKGVESIAISDIEQLKMNGIEISLLANGIERKIRLEYIEWEELNRVKTLVKDLSLRINQNNA